jgi:hypothetical protein
MDISISVVFGEYRPGLLAVARRDNPAAAGLGRATLMKVDL